MEQTEGTVPITGGLRRHYCCAGEMSGHTAAESVPNGTAWAGASAQLVLWAEPLRARSLFLFHVWASLRD